jgi:hypothetical protein
METTLNEKLDWEILTRPIQLEGHNLPQKKAIIRNDNGKVLGIVGTAYQPVLNSSLIKIAQKISETGKFNLDGFKVYYNGGLIHCYLSNRNRYLNINGHQVYESMLISNSHNGKSKFQIYTRTRMVRCGNIFSSPLMVFSKKHIGELNAEDVNVEELISLYQSKKDRIYSDFDGMDYIRVTPDVVHKLITEVHRMLITDSSLDKDGDWKRVPSMRALHQSIEKEMTSLGNNVFGLFNGVTWYTSHEMRNSDCELGKVNGTAALINQKAYRFCKNLKKNLKLQSVF